MTDALKVNANIGRPVKSNKDLQELLELYKKWEEDPSKSGEIRPLTADELLNPPSHMIILSDEEEELLKNISQNERVELYWLHQSLKTDRSFAEFLRDTLEERRKFSESLNR